MRHAVTFEKSEEYLTPADFLFFAEALFDFGGLSAEKEACQNVTAAVQLGETPSISVWEKFVDCSIKRNDIKPIALLVSNLHDVRLLSLVFDRLGKLLIGTPGYTYEEAWAAALNRILSSPLLDEETKAHYHQLASQNRRLAPRLSRNDRSSGAR